MKRSSMQAIAIVSLTLVLFLNGCRCSHAGRDEMQLLDDENQNGNSQQQQQQEEMDRRALITTTSATTTTTNATYCPSSADYLYRSRNSTCVVNYRCAVGRGPFAISGCGCGCRILATGAKNCPVSAKTQYYYRIRSNGTICAIRFRCRPGSGPFQITGCGCGCHRVTTTDYDVVTKCPTGPKYAYRSRKASFCSTQKFICPMGRQYFSVAGCGCGCKSIVCPSGKNYAYRFRQTPCPQTTFACPRGRTYFAVDGCGCGCKTV